MTKQTKEVEMNSNKLASDNAVTRLHEDFIRGGGKVNADKMTREEFDDWMSNFMEVHTGIAPYPSIRDMLWKRIDAIQSAPFVPDWSLKPKDAVGFKGGWVTRDAMGWPPSVQPAAGEFYLLAPSNPTDAELSAMWEKLSPEAKKRAKAGD